MEEKQKNYAKWMQAIPLAISLLAGVGLGLLIVGYLDSPAVPAIGFGGRMLRLVGLLAGVYAAFFVQLIIHEAGHWVFGRLTGYRLASFRIGSLIWVKDGEKLRFGRFSLAGTGGQCLMSPPEMVDGKMPVALYNLGGVLANVIAAAVFLGLYFLCRTVALLALLWLVMAVIGLLLALLNGIPVRMGPADNDGCNALSVSKSPDALYAFWIQLKVNERITAGERIKDMPQKWFKMPDDAAMKNSLQAAVGAFACQRLLDRQEIAQAHKQITRLLALDSALTGLHRCLLICDLIFCKLVGENRPEELDALLDGPQKKFMTSMKNYPGVLRTEYALAVLREKDLEKAAAVQARFDKIARSFPYPGEIEGERELMAQAAAKAVPAQ